MRIPAEQFWRLSLVEWRALCEGGRRRKPALTGLDLKQMMQMYPDDQKDL